MPRDILVIGVATHECDWQSYGGANCGCEWKDNGECCRGHCSVPVCRCTICGDYDYGDNAEAAAKRQACAEHRAENIPLTFVQ